MDLSHEYNRVATDPPAATPTQDLAAKSNMQIDSGRPIDQKQSTPRNRLKTKWIIGAVLVLVLVGTIAGILGWRFHHHNDHKSTSPKEPSPDEPRLQYINGTAGVVRSDPADASRFARDPRLHRSFYGLAYTPHLAQEPACGAWLPNITEDIQLMSQLTTRLRMYGSECNQSQLVLQAIVDTKVDMGVFLGVWIDDNATIVEQQKQHVFDALRIYGTKHVLGVVVGNEYLLRSGGPPSALQFLLGHIADFRTRLIALNLDEHVPVGTGDGGAMISEQLAAGTDFVMANIHPYYGEVYASEGVAWVWNVWTHQVLTNVSLAPTHPVAFVGETGWPTNATSQANLTLGHATAGVNELQTFLNTWVCQANANATKYFYFAPLDESWKAPTGVVEPYWGLFSESKQLKDITLPTCLSTQP